MGVLRSLPVRGSRHRLFRKLGAVYLLLLLVALAVVDVYVVDTLRKEHLAAAYTRLDSLAAVASGRLPAASAAPVIDDVAALSAWVDWLATGGVRATLVAADGRVLADSAEAAAGMENHGNRPEVREAFRRGSGRAVRRSETLRQDLVYLARRLEPADGAGDAGGAGQPLVLRLSLPIDRLDAAIRAYRLRLWGVSALVLVLLGGVSLLFSRSVSNRIRRLKDFSERVAGGDFRPLAVERRRGGRGGEAGAGGSGGQGKNDELDDLTDTLNRTAAQLEQTIDTLTGEREQSAAILASMAEGVVVVDARLRVVFCNQTFLRAVGVPAADGAAYQGRPVLELASRLDLLPLLQRTLAGGENVRGEVTAGFARPGNYAVAAAPIRSGGATAGIVCVLHDISEIRRLEQVRRDFVANVSHELRTPLTAIQGFAETLLDGALEEAGNARRFVRIIHEHALRLSRLTDDLLKLARIEAGEPCLEPRPLAVGRILHSCAETALFKARQKGLRLTVDAPPDLPLLCADPRAVEEIAQNLLQNAVRYTPSGGDIRVSAEARDGEMALAVSDTGIGIGVEDQRRIFERFYRADAARSRESGGTGLGLAIVKHLAEFHGGRVTVESEVGRGSTFRVFLPLDPPAPKGNTNI